MVTFILGLVILVVGAVFIYPPAIPLCVAYVAAIVWYDTKRAAAKALHT